jgi:hypothetical protein
MVARSFIRLLSLSASIAGLAAQVHAQELELGPGDDMKGSAPPAPMHASGAYAGVKAGGDQTPTIAVPVKPGTTPAVITWPGFQMQPDGSSRVFLQSTAPLNAQAAMTNDKLLVVDLGDATVAGPNNRRALYTSFFNTPVTRVEIKNVRKRVTVELTLRAPVQPRISSEQAKSGFFFVYIDFPPGSYVAAPAPRAASAPPPPPVTEATPQDDAPSVLDDQRAANANARARASTAMDGELPPGMGKPKASGKTSGQAGFKLGTK